MEIKQQALSVLHQALDNSTANFRDGQWEAIEELVERRSRLQQRFAIAFIGCPTH